MNDINKAAINAHEHAKSHGFWTGGAEKPSELLSKLALIHSEVSEIAECIRRNPKATSSKCPDLTVEEEECADVFLRLADYCQARGIDLAFAADVKHRFNLTRPYKHGKRI